MKLYLFSSTMSTSNESSGSDLIPSFIQSDTSSHPADVSMREVMTLFLNQAPAESIINQTRLMITSEHLTASSPTYGFFLCQLHLSKGVKIPGPSAVDETKGFQTVIYRFLFQSTYATIANPRIGFGSAPRSPAQVHTPKLSNPSGLDAIVDRQSNSGPRGPMDEGAICFQPFRF